MYKVGQEEVNTATFQVVQQEIEMANQRIKFVLDNISRILIDVRSLLANYEYQPGSPFFSQTDQFYKKIFELQEFLSNQTQTNLRFLINPIESLPRPREENTAAKNIFIDLDLRLSNIVRGLRDVIGRASKIQQLLNASSGQDWAQQLSQLQEFYKQLIEVLRLTQITQLAAIVQNVKIAYPISFSWKRARPPEDLKKWNDTKVKMDAFKRAYKDYSFPQVLYHFTKDWDMFERFNFKNWYKYNKSENRMKKKASDFIVQDREQKLVKKKKQLQSRVDSAKKVLREMIASGLINNQIGNKIFKILAMLEYEILQLSTMQVAASRTLRIAKQLERLGFHEGSKILVTGAQEVRERKTLIKTASKPDVERITKLLKEIKQVLNNTDYSTNLDKMFHIKKELQEMGRTSDMESVLKIIKDELDGLDKLNKKLVDIYVNLSRLPIEELSEEQDKQLLDSSPEKIKMPLEVKQEPQKIAPPPPSPSFPSPSKAKESPRVQSRPFSRPLPKVDKDIPNV